MILKGKGGIQYKLESSPFAQGGEGQIYNIIGHPDKVAKLYKAGKKTSDHEAKLLKMLMSPPEKAVLDQISWPLDVLYENNKFVGFIMRKFKLNEDLNVIYEYGSAAKYPEMSWGNKISIAKNLCVVLHAVHKAGHVCGDLNPKNISVDPNTGHVTFVDTDSYHITDGNRIYRCNVGMPEYLPVEIQKKMHQGLSTAPLPTFSQASDNFALAIHIFQLLMNGVHPFACAIIPSKDSVAIPDTSDSILKGECPFFKNIPGKQIPKFAPPADILPEEIKKLFHLAFIDGHKSPNVRPSAETWYYALERLENDLKKCKTVSFHEYHSKQKTCPWCEADKRFSGAISSATNNILKQSTFTAPISPKVSPPPVVYPSSTHNTGYSVPSNYSRSSYNSSRKKTYSSRRRKISGSTKKVLSRIVVIALVAALFGFVVWPKLIYPNISDKNFNTPELIQTYSGTKDNSTKYKTDIWDNILTIIDCDKNGNITATREFIHNKTYGKYNLTGQIIEKKQDGRVVIEFTAQDWVIQPDGYERTESFTAEINNNYTSFSGDSMTLTSGNNDKYDIKTADDLQKLSGSDGLYIIKNDIDLSGTNWTPIEGFSGTLLGNGHTISGLTIDTSSDNVGFFSVLNGVINNLKIENADIKISGRQENIGILCGKLELGNVINIQTTGQINADTSTNVGGVIGNVTVSGSFNINGIKNEASVIGLDNVGGIFGTLSGKTSSYNEQKVNLTDFENTGTISAKNQYAGGIVGYLFQATSDNQTIVTVSNFKNTGAISGVSYVGGMFGYAETDSGESIIRDSSNNSSVLGDCYIGCIGGQFKGLTVTECSNTGSTLTASGHTITDGKKYAYVGGFVGYGYLINNCTNEVSINYTGTGRYVGGLIGYSDANWSYSMSGLKNKANISGDSYVGGIFGALSGYTSSYYEQQVNLADFENIGTISAKNEYAGGIIGYLSQTTSNNQTILTVSGFKNTGAVSGASHVGGLLGYAEADSGEAFIRDSSNNSSVSGKYYVGCLGGQFKGLTATDCSNTGSTLTASGHITIDGEKYAYIGGFVGHGYLINNCTNEVSINYTGTGRYVGGLIGYSDANWSYSMSGLKNKANISGDSYVGGIFGALTGYTSSYYEQKVNLSDFENTGTISAKNQYAGGIVGYLSQITSNDETILTASNIRNTGAVSGICYIGGLFGYAKTNSGSSIVQDSSNSSSVTGEYYVGCLGGRFASLDINNCKNTGSTLSANGQITENGIKYAYVGGFVGYGHLANNCTNEVSINYKGTGSYVGGIIGYSDANWSYSMSGLKNKANISGDSYVGGIFGALSGYTSSYYEQNVSISDFENSGNISARNAYVGGICGYLSQTTSNDKTTLYVSEFVNTGTVSASEYSGGLFGYIVTDSGESSIMDSYTSAGAVSEHIEGIIIK